MLGLQWKKATLETSKKLFYYEIVSACNKLKILTMKKVKMFFKICLEMREYILKYVHKQGIFSFLKIVLLDCG